MKWFVYFNYPYPEQLGDGYDSLEDAIHAVELCRIPKWNVRIDSEIFHGGRHRVVWDSLNRAWVNQRNPYSTIEQEGWV